MEKEDFIEVKSGISFIELARLTNDKNLLNTFAESNCKKELRCYFDLWNLISFQFHPNYIFNVSKENSYSKWQKYLYSKNNPVWDLAFVRFLDTLEENYLTECDKQLLLKNALNQAESYKNKKCGLTLVNEKDVTQNFYNNDYYRVFIDEALDLIEKQKEDVDQRKLIR